MRRKREEGREPQRVVLPRKEEMQEARLVICPECGHASGRHLVGCSRARKADP